MKNFAASNGFRGDIEWVEIVRESDIAEYNEYRLDKIVDVDVLTGNTICENEDKEITIAKLLDIDRLLVYGFIAPRRWH